jgi:hypothetical protein
MVLLHEFLNLPSIVVVSWEEPLSIVANKINATELVMVISELATPLDENNEYTYSIQVARSQESCVSGTTLGQC